MTRIVIQRPPVRLLKKAAYEPGVYAINQTRPIPGGVKRVCLEFSRDDWPETGGDVIKVDVEVSYDGGSSWQYLMGCTAGGGVLKRPYTNVAIDIPKPELSDRQLRVAIQTFAALRTSCDLIFD